MTRIRSAQKQSNTWRNNPFLQGVQHGFKAFSTNISMIVTVVLLTIAYGIGIGITAIIARLARKQFLDISKGKLPLKKTYWKPVEQREHRMEESFRQF